MTIGDLATYWRPQDGNVLAKAAAGSVVRIRDVDWGAFALTNLGASEPIYSLRVDPVNRASELTVVTSTAKGSRHDD